MELILNQYNMKKLIITLFMALLPLGTYAQKVEKIYEEASIHYNNQNYSKAIPLFEKCIQKKYFLDGDIYVWLYESYKAIDNAEKGSIYIYEGIKVFPDNFYLNTYAANICLESNDNINAINYLNKAISLDQDNASLFYLKGNALMALGEIDVALHTYRQCSDVDAGYEFGYMAIGLYYYEKAVAITEQGMPDTISKDLKEALIHSAESFDASFSITKDYQLKISLSEYLMNIYNTLSYYLPDSLEYKEKYEYFYSFFNNGGLE